MQYNYTENRTAQQLTEIFEKIGNVEEHITQLEYDMKYDHLSLPQALREIQDGIGGANFVEALADDPHAGTNLRQPPLYASWPRPAPRRSCNVFRRISNATCLGIARLA